MSGSGWGAFGRNASSGGGFGGEGSSRSTANENPNNSKIFPSPPSQSVSSIRFCPTNDAVAVSSWDGTINVYQYSNDGNIRPMSQQKNEKPVLDIAWDPSGNMVFSANCDSSVRAWDLQANKQIEIGKHDAPVRCVESIQDKVVTGSWDQTIRIWDPKNPSNKMPSVNVQNKIYCMGKDGFVVGVGLSNKHVQIYDVRKLSEKMHDQQTVLKHQLRCIDIFPSNVLRDNGYAVGGIEGRAAVIYLTGDAKRNFSFKCHQHPRTQRKQNFDVHAVNCLRYNKKFGTFATGGSDGVVCVWHAESRSKLKSFERLPHSVVALDFDRSGTKLAYATSYDWSKGMQGFDTNAKKVQLYLHPLQQGDVVYGNDKKTNNSSSSRNPGSAPSKGFGW